jgi:hypothetical protein
MQRKNLIAVFLFVLIVFSFAFNPLYRAFNYYPTLEHIEEKKEKMSAHSLKYDVLYKIGQIAAVVLNFRVSLDTEVPVLPVESLPVFQGNASSDILYVGFADSAGDWNSSTEDICFLITNHSIGKTRISQGKLNAIEQVTADNSGEYIIHQVQNRNFVRSAGDFPMSSLGRVKITEVELVYFDLFDSYPYEYEGETTYYPAWKITAETANYGDEVLMIKAMPLNVSN